MNFPSREEVERIKQQYKAGDIVELVRMDDQQAPPKGTRGKVIAVDDTGTIHVSWEIGGTLGIVYGIDEVKKLERDKVDTIELGDVIEHFKGLECGYLDLDEENRLLMFIVYKGMRPEELKDLETPNNIRFRTAYFGGITWLFWQCGGMAWQDMAFNYNLAMSQGKTIDKPEGYRYDVNIVAIEGETGEVVSLRRLKLPEKQSGQFYRHCMEQASDPRAPKTQEANNDRVTEIYNRYTTAQLMKASKAM